MGKGSIDHPRTLVVQNICADLAKSLRVGVAVQEIILNLEVLSHGNKYVFSDLVSLFILDAEDLHRQSDRQIE